jgi:glutaredoxin
MTTQPLVHLYTRPDCHLCELAEQVLEDCGARWESVDIESDLELIRKYGNHIPVLYRADIDRELFWPFNTVTVQDFIEYEI